MIPELIAHPPTFNQFCCNLITTSWFLSSQPSHIHLNLTGNGLMGISGSSYVLQSAWHHGPHLYSIANWIGSSYSKYGRDMQADLFLVLYKVISRLVNLLKSICLICKSPIFVFLLSVSGARGGVVVKALCYKPAGRGFDPRRCHWNFSVI